MFPFHRALLMLAAFPIVQVLAAPKIEPNKTAVDCGIVVEGKTDEINASFTVRNTGDAPLKIENVRPGCGCTVVKFDTMVLPGNSGVIQSTVHLTGFQPGPISKYITVFSNAANNGSLLLTITATLLPAIELSEEYLSLTQQKPHALVLACANKNLHITSVGMTVAASSPTATLWQSNLPVPISFKWIPTDSTRKDGMRLFRLELTAPAVKERLSGEFVISTDDPEKPVIRLNGAIEK